MTDDKPLSPEETQISQADAAAPESIPAVPAPAQPAADPLASFETATFDASIPPVVAPATEAPAPVEPVADAPKAEETPAAASPVNPASPAESQPAAAESTAAPSVSPEPAATSPADPPSAAPVVESSSVEVASEAAASIREQMVKTSEELEAAVAQKKEDPGSTGPVEIPKDADIDQNLEAEIAAAMQGDTAQDTANAEVQPGQKLKGTVAQITQDDVFFDAGTRATVAVSFRQFPQENPPEVGTSYDLVVDSLDAEGLIRARLPRGKHQPAGNWDAVAKGQVVDCMVEAVNKGGLQVRVSNLRGFLPASQVDLGYVSDLEPFVQQKLTVMITEVNPKKRNLVVSRRALLQAEREEQSRGFWETLEVGKEFTGTVKSLKDYGAFISLGPVDGFLHIGEISWSRIGHPSDVLSEGQEVTVKVLKVDPEKNRISLGMKQLAPNPWTLAVDKYASGRIVTGRVTRIADFGAFVELEPGIEGMVHISELAWRRVGSVGEVLTVNESRDFQVLEIDPKRKRISLSVKAMEKRPEPPAGQPSEDAAEDAPAPPPRPANLRGGRGDVGGKGGLFGNPNDYNG